MIIIALKNGLALPIFHQRPIKLVAESLTASSEAVQISSLRVSISKMTPGIQILVYEPRTRIGVRRQIRVSTVFQVS